jgi:hypothetical protein
MFDPLSLPWHTAFWASDRSWASPVDGGSVASWRDASGNGHTASQATGSKQPTFHFFDLGGKPCVTFDGVDDFLQTASFTAIGQPATIVVVCQYLTVDVALTRHVIDGITTGGRMASGFSTPSGGVALYGMNAGTQITGGSFDGNAHITVGEFQPSTTEALRVDGAGSVVVGEAGSNSATGVTLGARFDGTTTNANVRVGFAGLIGRALTQSERIHLDSWAQDYYGIAVSDYQISGRLARSRRFKRV